jgi:hypothetical protein
MTINELIGQLQQAIDNGVPPDTIVLMACDSEGNSYAPPVAIDLYAVYKVDGKEHQIFDRNWSADDTGMSEEQWSDLKANGPRAVVVFP